MSSDQSRSSLPTSMPNGRERPTSVPQSSNSFPDAVTMPDNKIELSAQIAGTPQIDAPTNAIVPGLQRNVRPNLTHLDINAWQTRLLQIKLQVCRIEMDENAIGTGFLVGPDTVLTAWNVFEEAVKPGDSATNWGVVSIMSCFRTERFGPDKCSRCKPAAASIPVPTAPPRVPPILTTFPTPAELDYALLRMADRVGEEQVNGAPRGWIALPKAALPLEADGPILIVQHPRGMPMKLAMDTQAVIGLEWQRNPHPLSNQNRTRIRRFAGLHDGLGYCSAASHPAFATGLIPSSARECLLN